MKLKNHISNKYVLCISCMYLIPIACGKYYPFIIFLELIILLFLIIKYQKNVKVIAAELKRRGEKADIYRFTNGYFCSKINKNNIIILSELNSYELLTTLINNRRKLEQISRPLAKDFFRAKEALFIVSRFFQMTLFIFFLSIGICSASH